MLCVVLFLFFSFVARMARMRVCVVIKMKNFNRRRSQGHHGSKRRELAQHAYSHGSHAFTHTLDINTVTTTLCEASAQLLHNLESNFNFQGTSGRGSKPEVPRKTTTDSMPANQYHILEEKIQLPRRELNPHPPALVISSPGQERTPRLTH